MINMRIPPQFANQTPVDLNSALDQYQFFIENGQIVPKNTTLIWSRGILIFYVDRRANTVKLNDHVTQFSMNRLPQSVAGFERINKRPVSFDNTLTVGPGQPNQPTVFSLRSIVFSEVSLKDDGSESDYVIGSSTLIRFLGPKVEEPVGGVAPFICYDPYAPLGDQAAGLNRSPMRTIDDGEAQELAKLKGTIFIYANNKQDLNDVVDLVA